MSVIIVVAAFALIAVQDTIITMAWAVSYHVSNWMSIVLSYEFVFSLIKTFYQLRIFLSLSLPTVNGQVLFFTCMQTSLKLQIIPVIILNKYLEITTSSYRCG